MCFVLITAPSAEDPSLQVILSYISCVKQCKNIQKHKPPGLAICRRFSCGQVLFECLKLCCSWYKSTGLYLSTICKYPFREVKELPSSSKFFCGLSLIVKLKVISNKILKQAAPFLRNSSFRKIKQRSVKLSMPAKATNDRVVIPKGRGKPLSKISGGNLKVCFTCKSYNAINTNENKAVTDKVNKMNISDLHVLYWLLFQKRECRKQALIDIAQFNGWEDESMKHVRELWRARDD